MTAMLRSETIEIQNAVGRYCRTGSPCKVPGTDAGRLQEYRRLVRNIIHDTLSRAYPIAVSVLPEEIWETLADTFLEEHDCRSPEIWKLPYEFCEFVAERKFKTLINYPFLNDLLLFEWMEIELYTMADLPVPKYKTEGDFLTEVLLIHPEHKILHLEYPVHIFPADKVHHRKGNYFVLAFRHPESLEVKFLDVSMLHAWTLEQITSAQTPLSVLTEEACEIFSIKDTAGLKNHLNTFVQDLQNEGIVLGLRTT